MKNVTNSRVKPAGWLYGCPAFQAEVDGKDVGPAFISEHDAHVYLKTYLAQQENKCD